MANGANSYTAVPRWRQAPHKIIPKRRVEYYIIKFVETGFMLYLIFFIDNKVKWCINLLKYILLCQYIVFKLKNSLIAADCSKNLKTSSFDQCIICHFGICQFAVNLSSNFYLLMLCFMLFWCFDFVSCCLYMDVKSLNRRKTNIPSNG